MNPHDSSIQATESKIYREQALPEFVTVRRRRMTKRQHDRLRRAARKMLQDFRKFCKRKGLK